MGTLIQPVQSFRNFTVISKEATRGLPATAARYRIASMPVQFTPVAERAMPTGEIVGYRDTFVVEPVPGRRYAQGTINTYLRADTASILMLCALGAELEVATEDPASAGRYKHVVGGIDNGAPPSLTIWDFRGSTNATGVKAAYRFLGCDVDNFQLRFDASDDTGLIQADYNFLGFYPALVSTELTYEVQTVAITGSPTGGTFTLTYSAQTTQPIPYDASSSQIQEALEALSTVGVGNVEVTGGPGPATAWVVTFTGDLSGTNVAAMTGTAAGLTGGTTPAVTIAETVAGGSGTGAIEDTVVSSVKPIASWRVRARVNNGHETRIIRFDLNFQNGIARIKSAVGEYSDQGHNFGARQLTGTITRILPATDSETFAELSLGNTTFSLLLTALGHTAQGTGAAPDDKDEIEIYIPRCMVAGFPVRSDQDGYIVETVNFNAYRDDTLQGPMRFTFWNTLASI